MLSGKLAGSELILPKEGAVRDVTSDHGFVAFNIQYANGETATVDTTLNVATWNTMFLAVDIAKNGGLYNNNSWNQYETIEQFLTRKEIQFKQILAALDEHKLDVLTLQEADLLNIDFDTSISFNNKKLVINELNKNPDWTPELIEKAKSLRANFLNELKESGYRYISVPKDGEQTTKLDGKDVEVRRKELFTIYNTKTLESVMDEKNRHGLGKGVLPKKEDKWVNGAKVPGEFACAFFGHLNLFKIKGTERKLALVNMHGDYSADYKGIIANYVKEHQEAGYELIIMGDSNKHPGIGIENFITPENPTSHYYSSDPTNGNPLKDANGHVTLINNQYDLNRKDLKWDKPTFDAVTNLEATAKLGKNIDGAVISPTQHTFVNAYILTAETMRVVDGQMVVHKDEPSSVPFVSKVGKPPVNPLENRPAAIEMDNILYTAKRPKPTESLAAAQNVVMFPASAPQAPQAQGVPRPGMNNTNSN